MRDGTAFFQAVAFKPNFIEKFGEEAGTEKFDVAKRLSQETSVYVTGIVKEDERSKFGYELDVTDLKSSVSHKTTQSRQKNTVQTSSWTIVTYGCVRVSRLLSSKSVTPLSMRLMNSLKRMALSSLIAQSCLEMRRRFNRIVRNRLLWSTSLSQSIRSALS